MQIGMQPRECTAQAQHQDQWTAQHREAQCYSTSSLLFSAACEEGDDTEGKAASEDFCRGRGERERTRG